MEDPIEHQEIMDEIIAWAGDSQDKWDILLREMKRRYIPTLPLSLTPLTPREILLDWVSNQYGYSRGLAEGKSADISFHRRVISTLERAVPMALSLDPVMEDALMMRIRAKGRHEDDNTSVEMEGV